MSLSLFYSLSGLLVSSSFITYWQSGSKDQDGAPKSGEEHTSPETNEEHPPAAQAPADPKEGVPSPVPPKDHAPQHNSLPPAKELPKDIIAAPTKETAQLEDFDDEDHDEDGESQKVK